ncbi:hypothetical protein AAU61_13700 [Desulfocarbo indianensis]|nr:hypothetical protein AAU61_13700 [Desulfocarbo indianensis]
MQVKLVVVATDFSPSADRAVERAVELAKRRRAGLLVVHVIPPVLNASPLLGKASAGAFEEASNGVAARLRQISQEELQARYLAGTGLDQVQAEGLCLEGKVAPQILELIADRGADLLVMGATGASGLGESLFGSVALKLLRKAPCSVLVVRAEAGASQAQPSAQ